MSGNAATLAAKKATSTVPIVSSGMANPVETGIVSSLAHPGGNVTGIVPAFGNELAVKRVELLRELLPRARRVRVFRDERDGPDPQGKFRRRCSSRRRRWALR
ncbi:MAG: hypothetical protein IPF73_13865 [Betaproteobacteria bacterium]|nr:hypothetical protein [Betaproteobacteria bacterium]